MSQCPLNHLQIACARGTLSYNSKLRKFCDSHSRLSAWHRCFHRRKNNCGFFQQCMRAVSTNGERLDSKKLLICVCVNGVSDTEFLHPGVLYHCLANDDGSSPSPSPTSVDSGVCSALPGACCARCGLAESISDGSCQVHSCRSKHSWVQTEVRFYRRARNCPTLSLKPRLAL